MSWKQNSDLNESDWILVFNLWVYFIKKKPLSLLPQAEHCFKFLRFLSQDNHKLSYIQQLRPTQTIQPRIKLKLFGHPGAGKSTLLESLKCGILRSFFRRRRTRMTNTARHPNSPVNSKPPGRSSGSRMKRYYFSQCRCGELSKLFFTHPP